MKKPSVTQLLKLLDKPALLNWANKQGLAGIDINIDKDRFLKAGTSIHNQILNYHEHGTPFQNIDTENNYKRFMSGKIILDIEKDIETEWFTGRLDARLKHGETIYLIDYKNNSKGAYFENKLQLVSYGMAVECDRFAVVSVPTFTTYHIIVEDRKPYEEIIKALSIIYQNKKLIP